MPQLTLNELIINQDMSAPLELDVAPWRLSYVSSRKPEVDHNEDALLIAVRDSGELIVAVADGAGGMRGGDIASATAVETLRNSLKSTENLREAILQGIEDANSAICNIGIGAITTLSVISVNAEELRSYHIGDSATWVLGQRGKVKFQTLAHSPVGYALESGYLNEEEALHHEERHLISNALGSVDLKIELSSPVELSARDRVLLGSDGLFDNLSPQSIIDGVRSGPLQARAQELWEVCSQRMLEGAVDEPTKPDDLTFVLLERG